LAINACKEGAVGSVNDLAVLSEMKEEFRLAFSQAMIRAMVLSALERDKDNIQAATSNLSERDYTKQNRYTEMGKTPNTTLPQGKR
jgi:hypothetical protein